MMILQKGARLLFCILVLSVAAWAADDSDVAPNKMQTNPPTSTPKAQVTTVPPASSGNNGSAMSPQNGSQMGLGIQIPFGRKSRPVVQQPNDSEDRDSDQPKKPQQ